MSAIQSLWIGSHLQPQHLLSIRSFLANGHSYHLYVYDPPRNVPTGVELRDATEVLPRDEIFCYQTEVGRGSYSAFSNRFRYCLLFQKGGWWADTDVVCLRPWRFPQQHVFAAQGEGSECERGAATCVIRAPRGSRILEWCAGQAAAIPTDTLRWGQAGPELLQRAAERFGIALMPSWTFCPIDWREYRALAQAGSSTWLPRSAYGVHLWHEMWRRNGKATVAEPTSIYAQLCRRYGADSAVIYA